MIASSRHRRATLRTRIRALRTTRRATKAVATGLPQPASTHLIAAGIDPATAHRYAAAFSRSVIPTEVGHAVIKLRGRTRKTVPVKLYGLATFRARLAVYRPKNTSAAETFARAAVAA